MMKLALVFLVLAGCGKVFEQTATVPAKADSVPMTMMSRLQVDPALEIPAPPRADEAVAIVVALLGIQGKPDLHWYGGPDLHCVEDPSVLGWDAAPGWCVGGLENGGTELVPVAPEWQPLHDTSLRHELAHMRAEEVGLDGDPNHQSHFFAPGGEVDQARSPLVEAGL